MKRFIDGASEAGATGGVIGTRVVEINSIEDKRLRAALEHLGDQLAEQYRGKTTPHGSEIVGVDLIGIQFSLITRRRSGAVAR